jgi:ABC-2 type transport system permease protein
MKHDWQVLAADKILWVIAALLLILIAGGIYNGASLANARKISAAETERKALEVLEKQRTEAAEFETGAHPLPSPASPVLMPIGKAVPAVLYPAPLAAVAVGQSDLYPYSTSVDLMTEKNDLFQEYEQDNPINLLTGKFDLAFVLVFIFPLLILALSYNLLSAERENGTLQLTMANAAVSVKKIVAGKFLTRALIILAFSVGFSIVGLLVSSVDFTDSDNISRIGLFIVAIALYSCFWFAVAILVNSFGFSSATNAAILGGIWVIVAVIMPSFLNVAATTVHPVPSRLEFVSKIREADNETRSAGEKLLQTYYGDHPELAPPGGMSQSQASQRFYAIRQERQKRLLPEVEQFERQLSAQNDLVARYRVLSPAVVMQETLNDIAGTSVQRQKSYVAQIRKHVGKLQNHFVPKLMRRENLTSSDYDRIPRFQFQEETTSVIAERSSTGFLLLLLPTMLIGILGFIRLSRFSLIN